MSYTIKLPTPLYWKEIEVSEKEFLAELNVQRDNALNEGIQDCPEIVWTCITQYYRDAGNEGRSPKKIVYDFLNSREWKSLGELIGDKIHECKDENGEWDNNKIQGFVDNLMYYQFWGIDEALNDVFLLK